MQMDATNCSTYSYRKGWKRIAVYIETCRKHQQVTTIVAFQHLTEDPEFGTVKNKGKIVGYYCHDRSTVILCRSLGRDRKHGR